MADVYYCKDSPYDSQKLAIMIIHIGFAYITVLLRSITQGFGTLTEFKVWVSYYILIKLYPSMPNSFNWGLASLAKGMDKYYKTRLLIDKQT